MATTTGHPGRILIVLAVLVAGLITLMAVSGTWTPKLGLDLRGGTTITLTAKNTTGTGAVDPNSLQLAKTIIQSRVDSLGVGESEVTTSGDNQTHRDCAERAAGRAGTPRWPDCGVAVPSGVRRRTNTASGADAKHNGRPSQGPTAKPSGQPSPAASETAKAPSPAHNRQTKTGNNEPMPALPTAPPLPVDKACVPADGKGIPPDKALDWQPTEACQAAFAEFTCETKVTEVADQGLFACNQEKTEKYLLGPTLIEGNQLTSAVAGIPAEQCQLGREPGVQLRQGRRPSRRQRGRFRSRASHKTALPSCWTESRSPHHRSTRPSPAAGPRSRETSPRRARPSWPTC